MIKQKLGKYHEALKGTHDLEEWACEVWPDIDLETYRSLIWSMESWVQAILLETEVFSQKFKDNGDYVYSRLEN